MISLRKLVWLILSGTTFYQGTSGFVECLAPQENEVVVADSTYIIRWAAKSSNGNGTMTLRGSQTLESLSNIWEIADSIDVADGSFSWPVIGFPALGGSLAFYGFNFSLEGSQIMFNISPPFNIVSTRRHDTGRDMGQGAEGGGGAADMNGDVSHSVVNTNTSPVLTPLPALASTAPTALLPSFSNEWGLIIMSPAVTEVLTSSSNNGYSTSSRHFNNSPSPTQRPVSSQRIGSGAIAGIVFGAATALVAISSLLGLVLYYRHGKFRKAELEAEESQVTIKRVYELEATREVQEADGRMKPVELDSAVPSSGLHAANIRIDGVLADGDSIIEDECSEY
ncbi:hypothetical protein FHL15_006740 [Xylaria flabelliformis]|uniref:Yeast cell wall synthesis Kre9/Knh1-like N-terminal domain-containing protein n=1 Tax=Xylaria flabelliformis TaxID=2512241 RepID=A0A553HWM1_9PEZI|nr:hypothetical protein FHL15_006740 [Xylaria flabelliformis]